MPRLRRFIPIVTVVLLLLMVAVASAQLDPHTIEWEFYGPLMPLWMWLMTL
jgi:hypothetical protein